MADDDVMILDTGHEVYLWLGPASSDVEKKLAFKSAQVSNGITTWEGEEQGWGGVGWVGRVGGNIVLSLT